MARGHFEPVGQSTMHGKSKLYAFELIWLPPPLLQTHAHAHVREIKKKKIENGSTRHNDASIHTQLRSSFDHTNPFFFVCKMNSSFFEENGWWRDRCCIGHNYVCAAQLNFKYFGRRAHKSLGRRRHLMHEMRLSISCGRKIASARCENCRCIGRLRGGQSETEQQTAINEYNARSNNWNDLIPIETPIFRSVRLFGMHLHLSQPHIPTPSDSGRTKKKIK